MQEYTLVTSPEDAGMRIDVFVTAFAKLHDLGLSRTALQGLIEEGAVVHAGGAALTAKYKIKPGDEFILRLPQKAATSLLPENIPLDIVYQDSALAIINKQRGLVVHPAPGNYEHTLVNALLYHLDSLSDINPERPGIVHRLDKETSGLLVVAKTNSAHMDLAKQFASHSIKKKYVALVKGVVEFDEHEIEIPIGRHPTLRKNMAVGYGAHTKEALTRYRTIRRGKDFSFLELEPYTGRTHQLRVHLKFLGHPILGDAKYGKNTEFSRLALHARYLGFIHPKTGKFVEFSIDIPQEFKEFLASQK